MGSYCDNADMLRRNGLGWLMDYEGFTIRDSSGRMSVFYNEQYADQHIRFTLAHELGHIFLGHLSLENDEAQYKPTQQGSAGGLDLTELEADAFAIEILAPACVLWQLGVHSPKNIAQLCNISISAARFRAAQMANLYQREADCLDTKGCSGFLQSPLERQVLAQFEEYIQQTKE